MPDTTGDEGVGSAETAAIDEIAYKLENWDDEAFVEAEEALRRAGVSFRREGFDTLIVAPEDEETVDGVLDEVEAERIRLAESGDGPMVSAAMGTDEDASHEELIYELVDWSPEMRNQLSLVLEREEIIHEWEGDDLVVAAAVETQVDGLIDQIEQGDELAPAGEDIDDEADYNLLSDLFVAADRLAGSPSDLALCGDLVDAAGPARSMPVPFGLDENSWRMIQQLTSSWVDAIEVEEADEVVGERARALSDLLRAYV
jgi:hypothetical protein